MKVSHLCLALSLLLVGASSFGNAEDHKTVEVVGFGECIDCTAKSIKTSHAFSGLGVTIDCKIKSGTFERRGVDFKVRRLGDKPSPPPPPPGKNKPISPAPGSDSPPPPPPPPAASSSAPSP